MLDLDHPMSPYIFAAARHLDRIKQGCLHMSVEATADRRQTRSGLESEFAALRWLNEHRFENSPSTAILLDALQKAVGSLAERPMSGHAPASRRPLECSACAAKTSNLPQETWRYCVPCTREVIDICCELEGFERGFGTCAI